MEVVSKIVRMRAVLGELRRTDRPIGLVPTMGALHEGHLSLVRLARERDAEIVVSIFVNPKQFESEGDLASYPWDLTRDAELLVSEGVKYVFAPDVNEMYPDGFASKVAVADITDRMVGELRPGHFDGVTTVVTKLLNIVQPDFAVFGWKDAQQLLVVRRMVKDLDLDVEIIGAPTVRESDGLACSSRNVLLDEDARRAGTRLYRSLQEARKLVDDGERSAEVVASAVRQALVDSESDVLTLDYVEIVRADDFRPCKKLEGLILILISGLVRVEGREPVRLIDNIRIAVGNED